ncbi:MAG: glutamine synthetase [Bdellovibrionales bacterium]|nr:glutamine synthetase [Bdellovibrionales bacterium]
MDASTLENKIAAYESEGIQRVKIAITDVDGILRGKYISLDKFRSIALSHAGFCDCVFGWDVVDNLYDNSKFTGWHTAYPDAQFVLDLSSERRIPEENIPFFIADFLPREREKYHPVCPRNVLKRVLDRAENLGFKVQLAFEYEFFLFAETSHSIRQKNYRQLEPLTPGMFGYSILRNSTESELFNGLMDYCLQMEMPLEGLHCETGPGVWEAAIKYETGMRSVDNASLFKTFCKVFFQKQGITPTFMARWSLDYPGQSGHLHQSLCDAQSEQNLFFDENAPYHMSELMKSYVAGQIKYLKPLLSLAAPTINSYTRLVKGFWAPTASTWGVENRTTALRVIPGSEKSQRVEFRVGAADSNPYLTAAAMIGAGLLGIEQKLKLEDPVQGNAYAVQDSLPKEKQLPSSLDRSVDNLEACEDAKDLLGDEFVEHFIASRRWEVREAQKAITDWQLQRYFEII